MADPIKTDAIEDVLSSIRRLVSDYPTPPAQPAQGGERLILTPSQRLVEPEDPWLTVKTRHEDEAHGDAPLSNMDEARSAEETASAPVEEEEGEQLAPVAFMRSLSSVNEYEPGDGNNAVEDLDQLRAVEELAEVRARQLEAASGDGGEVACLEPAGAETLDQDASGAEELEAGRAPEIDAVMAAMACADADQADATPVEQPASVAQAAEATEPADSEAAGLAIDEDALRALIAEVLREELSGDIGLRITRNIRKLVRRELRQALDAGGLHEGLTD